MVDITFNIGYESMASSGILNKFPIYYQLESFKELSESIRNQTFEWILWAHENYVSKSSLCFYVSIWEEDKLKGDYWNWEFAIKAKNIREFQPFLQLSREEVEEMKIQRSREDKLEEILNSEEEKS
jgi:competence protein ComGF